MSKKKSKKKKNKSKSKKQKHACGNFCSMPVVPELKLDPSIGKDRMDLIVVNKKKWVNGTRLKYFLYSDDTYGNIGGNLAQRNAVIRGFRKWQAIGIGIEFIEVNNPNESTLRIGFLQGDGSWSYVGRDNWNRPKSERTMNFGWDITSASGLNTILHEIGHALGFPHEHQNPKAGIIWNRQNVIDDLSQPPNSWGIEQIEHNVLRAKNSDAIKGSDIDEDSIMMYPMPASWIEQPSPMNTDGIQPEPGLSNLDKEWIKKFYPAEERDEFTQLELFKTEAFTIDPGEQQNYCFTAPETRDYEIRTFGQVDTVMVLFEKSDGEEIYLSGDDDSGTDFNSYIKIKLVQGREYIVRIRLYTKAATGNSSVMVF